jgi:hypothetical protein
MDATLKKQSILVILRREYLEIAENNFCAAKLIEYFKHWTKWKLKTHRTPWVYQPLKNIYADLMGEHSLHVIRAAIDLLERLGILSKQKNPGNKQDKTWQYKINMNVLSRLLEHRKFNSEHSTFNAEQHQQITNPKTSKTQQQVAAGQKTFEPNWNALEQEVKAWESSQLALESATESDELSKGINQEVTTLNESSDSLSENSAAAPNDNLEKLVLAEVEQKNYSQAVEPSTTHNHYDYDEDSSNEPSRNSSKPSSEELGQVYQQLREIPCVGGISLNQSVRAAVINHWENVPGAIAYVKEAIRTWKKVDSPEAVFVKACRQGIKPETWNKPKREFPQPTQEQLEQLATLRSKREILDYYKQPDGLWIVDTGKSIAAWWEVLNPV